MDIGLCVCLVNNHNANMVCKLDKQTKRDFKETVDINCHLLTHEQITYRFGMTWHDLSSCSIGLLLSLQISPYVAKVWKPKNCLNIVGFLFTDEFDAYIIVSFVNATLVLSIGETVEEVTDSGFLGTTPTLSCSLLGEDALVQVSDHLPDLHACTIYHWTFSVCLLNNSDLCVLAQQVD